MPEAKQWRDAKGDGASTRAAVVADESDGHRKHKNGCDTAPLQVKKHIDGARRQASMDGVATAPAEAPQDDANDSGSAISTPPLTPLHPP